jgi:hypothetical protein
MMLGLDLFNELAHRLRWQRVSTIEGVLAPEHEKLLILINRALETLPSISDWPLLQTEGTIRLLAEYTSDLTVGLEEYVTATQDSDTLTVDNMAFDASFVGRAIQVSGDNYPYRITAVLSPTQVTLNRAWISDSITPADQRTILVAMDRYVLADDFDRPIDDIQNLFGGTVRAISPEEFRARRRKASGITPGDPEVFTIYGTNDNETSLLIHFDPFPRYARILEYPYVRSHPRIETDDDKILFPKKHIEALIEVIHYVAKRDHEDEAQMDVLLHDKMQELNTTLLTNGSTETRLQLQPDQTMRKRVYQRFAVRGWRANWGSRFDIMGNYDLPK